MIGPQGLGNIQQYERDLAVYRQSRDPSFPIVPVILPKARIDRPFNFLQIVTWIDFSHVSRVSDAPAEVERLAAAVQGISSAGLNAAEVDRLLDRILTTRRNGVTVVVVEHNMELVMNVADRILVMDYGQRLFEGVPADVQKDPAVVAAYLGGELS